jgi:hypothetical protein
LKVFNALLKNSAIQSGAFSSKYEWFQETWFNRRENIWHACESNSNWTALEDHLVYYWCPRLDGRDGSGQKIRRCDYGLYTSTTTTNAHPECCGE